MAELGVDLKVEELEPSTWIDRIVTTDEYNISWDYHFQRAVDPAWTLSLAFFYPPGQQNISRYKDDQIGGSHFQRRQRARPGQAEGLLLPVPGAVERHSPGIIIGEFVLYHVVAS